MISLNLANNIIKISFDNANALGSKPLAIVVVNAGGGVVSSQKQDGCGTSRMQLSQEKAQSALALHMPTRVLASFFNNQPEMHAILREATGKTLLPLAGGVLVKDTNNHVIGAVGISGGSLEHEEQFVIDAIQSCGLISDPA